MVSLYKHHVPSTTSLSDADDNDDETVPFAFCPDSLQPIPVQWSSNRPLQPAMHSPISTVPPEVLIQILKHLHSPRDLFAAMRVSRTFCQCAVELLWHKPSFPKYHTIYKMALFLRSNQQTFTYASFIRRLNFLTHGHYLTDEMFRDFNRCDRLERLTLIGCKGLSDAALTDTLPAFSNLVSVDLSNVVNTTSVAVIGLASVAACLQGINLTGCDKVSDEGIIALAANCPLLRRIKLSGLSLLTDKSVSALAERCPMLLEIDLHNCELLTDASIRLIWTNLFHMREMRLSHCTQLTDSAFPAPFDPDHAIDVNPFSNSTTKMEELPPLIINRVFENLRMLDLTGCLHITDHAVEGIISHTPKIRNLVLSKCVLLTDRTVESICRLGRHLHYLHLGHASKITDRSVRLLARSCTRIRYIDFANCAHLTDMSVFELSALPKLRRIGLVRVNQLTDEAIYALAERHATLERIHLSYCDQISVMAIHFLLLKLHKLTHLSLTGVPAFRQPELQRFCREAPKDFNTAQRLTFCVFSGKGVSQLRTYLTELFDSITEMNNTDETEYEDDEFDGEGYQEDETPEPESVAEVQSDTVPRQHDVSIDRDLFTLNPPSGPSTTMPPQPPAESQHDSTTRASTIYMPSHYRITPDRVPAADLAEASTRLALHAQESSAPTILPSTSSRKTPIQRQHRNLADSLPIIESSASPSPIGTPGHVSAAASDNGAGFFRAYDDRPIPSPLGGDGSLTPDLNFAEIGHGRVSETSTGRGHFPHRPRRSLRPAQDRALRRHSSVEYTSSETANRNSSRILTNGTQGDLESGSNSVNRGLHESVQMALDGEQRGRPGQTLQRPEPRARSVRRQIKNTFQDYASSLFHRSGHPNEGDAGTSRPSGSRNGRPR